MAVIRIVVSSIDTALRCDGVSTTRGILIAEGLDVITKFSQRSSSSAAGQAGSNDNDIVLAFVGGIDQFQVKAGFIPGLFNWSGRTFSVKYHNNPLNSEFVTE